MEDGVLTSPQPSVPEPRTGHEGAQGAVWGTEELTLPILRVHDAKSIRLLISNVQNSQDGRFVPMTKVGRCSWAKPLVRLRFLMFGSRSSSALQGREIVPNRA